MQMYNRSSQKIYRGYKRYIRDIKKIYNSKYRGKKKEHYRYGTVTNVNC